MSDYTWDPEKAATNLRKHRVTFDDAESVARNLLSRREMDVTHSIIEERDKVIGYSSAGELLVVVVSESSTASRIISARRATKRERHAYETRS